MMGLKLWTDAAGGKPSTSEGGATAQGTGDPAAIGNLAELGEHLTKIVVDAVAEHQRWSEGFHQWKMNMLQNMQPVPPQADMDFAHRLQAILDFLQKFSAPAAILAKCGHDEFSKTLAHRISGYNGLSDTFQSTTRAMQADNAATALAIGKIGGEMMKETAAAGAERQRLRNETAKSVYDSNAKILKDQQEASDRHHDQISKALRS